APNAEHGDLVLFQGGKIGIVAKDDPPRVRPHLATDDVEQRCFPGAIGANEGTQLATIDVKIDLPQGLEAVKTDRNVLEVDDASWLLHYASSIQNLKAPHPRESPLPEGEGIGAGRAKSWVRARRMRCRSWLGIPTSPSGNRITTPTNRPPRI